MATSVPNPVSIPKLTDDILHMVCQEVSLTQKAHRDDGTSKATLIALRLASKRLSDAATPFLFRKKKVMPYHPQIRRLLLSPLKSFIRRLDLFLDENWINSFRSDAGIRLRMQPNTTAIRLCRSNVTRLFTHLPDLLELKIEFDREILEYVDDENTVDAVMAAQQCLLGLVAKCPKLRLLELWFIPQDRDSLTDQQQRLSPALSGLRHLRLADDDHRGQTCKTDQLASFIGRMNKLQIIELQMLSKSDHNIGTFIVRNLSSPHLSSIVIDCAAAIESADLCQVLVRHQKTLRSIRLIDVDLLTGAWADFFMQVVNLEKLNQLWVASLGYDGFHPNSTPYNTTCQNNPQGQPYGVTGLGIEQSIASTSWRDFHAIGECVRFVKKRPMEYKGTVAKDDNLTMSRFCHLLPLADVTEDPSKLGYRTDGRRYVLCERISNIRSMQINAMLIRARDMRRDEADDHMDW